PRRANVGDQRYAISSTPSTPLQGMLTGSEPSRNDSPPPKRERPASLLMPRSYVRARRAPDRSVAARSYAGRRERRARDRAASAGSARSAGRRTTRGDR